MSKWLAQFVELFTSYGRDRYQEGLADARNIAEDVANRSTELDARVAANEIARRISDLIAARL
jgi:hypothetical protein